MKKTNYIANNNRFYFYTENDRIDELGLRRLGGEQKQTYMFFLVNF